MDRADAIRLLQALADAGMDTRAPRANAWIEKKALAIARRSKRILPLAAEVKAAVLTALPFGRGRLFRAVHGQGLLKCMHTSETAARVRHSVRRFAA
jgi:hypothetical protein